MKYKLTSIDKFKIQMGCTNTFSHHLSLCYISLSRLPLIIRLDKATYSEVTGQYYYFYLLLSITASFHLVIQQSHTKMHLNKIVLVFRLFALEPFITNGRYKNVVLITYSLVSVGLSIGFMIQLLDNFFEQTAMVFDVAFMCKLTVLLCSHIVIVVQVI